MTAGGAAGRSEVRAGMLLVATPALVDPNFADTVVLLLDVDDHGALGVVLNRVRGARGGFAYEAPVESAAIDPPPLVVGGHHPHSAVAVTATMGRGRSAA